MIKQQNTCLHHKYHYWIYHHLPSFLLLHLFIFGVGWGGGGVLHTYCGIITDIICIIFCRAISMIQQKSIIIMFLKQHNNKNPITIKQKNTHLYHHYHYWILHVILSFWLISFYFGGFDIPSVALSLLLLTLSSAVSFQWSNKRIIRIVLSKQ